MPSILSLPAPFTLGNNVGPGSDGVIAGSLTLIDPFKFLLKTSSAAARCITDDGNLYTHRTTEAGEATANDVELLPAAPAVEDATYFGHATSKFLTVWINITTQGVGTWEVAVEYRNSLLEEWSAVPGLVDGTTAFTATVGWKSITFTDPENWGKCLVDNDNGYWVRVRVTAFTSATTRPLAGQAFVATQAPAWVDDTVDMSDADAGDVDLLPAFPVIGDGPYFVSSTKFCKIKLTTSQARTGTLTLTPKYWNGSAMTAIPTVRDDSSGFSGAAGTHLIHFVPPADWLPCIAENGPNGAVGYVVSMEVTAFTTLTQQPKATRGWLLSIASGGGIFSPETGLIANVSMQANTISGVAADSTFLLVNVDQATCVEFVWTKGVKFVSANVSMSTTRLDHLAIVQITEDGTTEFADSVFYACY